MRRGVETAARLVGKEGEYVHLQQEGLGIAQRALNPGVDSCQSYQARDAGADIGDGRKQDEGVGYRPESLEEDVGDDDQCHADE